MPQKNQESVDQNTQKYEEYFKEDLEAIEEELQKSKHYSSIIDTEIEKLSGPSLGANKGTQRYLIEHITNAVQLQTQRQGLRRDRFAIKKAIIDYATKFADESERDGESKLVEKINQLLEMDKKNKDIKIIESKPTDNASLDDEIDKRINNIDNGN